jgi:hypothetical protein
MPKKYRIDMTITSTETNTELGTAPHEEHYKDDAEAMRKFLKKVDAAEKAGKPDRPN